MKIRPLEDVLKEHPKFEPKWTKKDDKLLENKNYGSVKHVVVCDDEGKPIYDQIELREQPGSIAVPYFFDRVYHLGVIEKPRRIIEDPTTGEQGTTISTEFPMGFANKGETSEETARRELSEETNAVIRTITYLGSINPLPAYYAVQRSNEVFAAEIDQAKLEEILSRGLSKEAQKEGIVNARYVSIYEVRDLINSGEIFCGLTQSALAKFICHFSPFK